MRWKLTALAVPLMAIGAGTALAQSLNADLNLGGGIGVGRHAGGFSGTMGDPELFPGPRDPAWPGAVVPAAIGMPGGIRPPAYLPTAPGYGAPLGAPPIELYFPPPAR